MTGEKDSPSISRFSELSQSWLHDRIAELERNLLSKETKVRDLGAEITHLWRDILALRQTLKSLQETQQNLNRDSSVEFERLSRLSEIKSIDVGAGCLKVDTNPLVVDHGGKKFRMGEFRFEIYLNGYVHLINLSNPCRYPFYDHPHIRDGKPCLGNHTEALSKLIAEGQFSTVVAILLSYLQSYNPEDAYCDITLWPEMETDAQPANR